LAGLFPIICAGDLFDRWNVEPELINFALKHLPDGMICVPGQHDLPNHRLDQVHRSGYGVLVEAGKIRCIAGKVTGNLGNGFVAHGFGWGQDIQPYLKKDTLHHLAVVHQYIWTVGNSYVGAPMESHLSSLMKKLKGYQVATFGDNHQKFLKKLKTGTTVFNCGGFIRRKSDEMDYHPAVGILMDDGSIREHLLDTSADKFHENTRAKEDVPVNMKEFIDGLEALGEHGLNFREAVENYLHDQKINEQTKRIILQALDV
jgi:hypothetical protein